MRQLVGAFGELRELADQGLIQYPYSTREVVNVIKHLQKYKDDGVASVVRNVFDFDTWSGEAKETVIKVMHKYGIPVGATASNVNLAKRFPLPDPVLACTWRIQKTKSPTPSRELPVATSSIEYKGPLKVGVYEDYLSPSENRSSVFTEQQNFWSLPIYETCIISGIASNYAADSKGKEQYGVHVATLSPFALYSIYPQFGPSLLRSILLHDVVTVRRGLSSQAKVNIACLPNEILAIHEEATQNLLLLNPSTGEISPVQTDSFIESLKQTFNEFTDAKTANYRMSKHLANEGVLFLWELEGTRLKMYDFNSGNVHFVTLPFQLKSFIPLNRNEFILTDSLDNKFLLKGDGGFPNILYSKISSPSTLLSPSNDYAAMAVGFPELDYSDNELYLWQRNETLESPSRSDDPSDSVCVLPEAGQIVRVIEKLPETVRKDSNITKHARYLEITDLVTHGLFYLPIPQASTAPMWNFLARDRVNDIFLCPHGQDGVASVDSAGGVRLWETGSIRLETALSEWRKMVGYQDGPLRMEIERESGKDVTSPKHGKEDPTNDPHVGGNTWAGGTGGRDTAGLGGKGGPYRLDAGHDVHQIPDWEKEQVPEEVKRAAREMAQKAFKERLREIQMSEYDASLYEKLVGNVRPQIRSLRNIVSSLQARTRERQWLRHRTDGELDDLKLIEGLAGEKNVYRQRREEEPEIGAPQTKPKRLRLVVDVSGSMYRFNGHDGRLERELEVTLMVMEAFEGFENKFKYDIYGHSGEEVAEPLVKVNNIPKNNKERLEHMHSFVLSGDNTVEAARNATKTLSQEDSDESFVILLSDANLDRYGIHPRELNNALNMEPSVNSYAIFIGSLGDQADRLRRALPAGRSFVCLDLSQLPQILQQIFTSAVLT
ncbi:von Willebrand factor A domain-containing protein 8 [Armadillidium nasatum]|uniref:von Willebrand factor A domain-containing protein 8 n=1 Tax=Armadillidium nasatum TaxID=96803 RepID=A0A5N5SPY1_9CRUS|nr:von Willebrand factor A domain-containing protein 8 [Armadillidium nasatum]